MNDRYDSLMQAVLDGVATPDEAREVEARLAAHPGARARFEELREVRDQADSLAEALAARKAIERAKGLLMEKEGLSEADAFARLRKASQVSGRPLKVVAEAVVATLDP
jgi:AmiR/NasT family two-component response regulator